MTKLRSCTLNHWAIFLAPKVILTEKVCLFLMSLRIAVVEDHFKVYSVRIVQTARRQEFCDRSFWRSQSLLFCFVETDHSSSFMLALHLRPSHLNLPSAGVTPAHQQYISFLLRQVLLTRLGVVGTSVVMSLSQQLSGVPALWGKAPTFLLHISHTL